MLRTFAMRACMTIAVALHVSAAELSAQSTDSLPSKASIWRIKTDSAFTTWVDRYASMLSVSAEQGGLPLTPADPRVIRLRAMRMALESLKVRSTSIVASLRPECPMPVAKMDSSRVAEMKVAPRDSGPSSPWAVPGRLTGCTNPLADSPR